MITAIVTIVMFLIMVSLHEFGHYIVARVLDFKILEYAIGFGPAIFKREKNSILYSVRVVPFGGYCKFEGEDEESSDPRAFSNRPVWRRILVVAAGGVFNIILGFLIFMVIMPSLSPVSTNVINSVVENSYLEQCGVQPGDKIIEIDGKSISFYNDITLYTSNLSGNEEIDLTIKRNGEKLDFTVKPTEQKITYNYTDEGVEYISAINGEEEMQLIPYSDNLLKQEDLIGKSQVQTRYIIGFVPQTQDITALNIWGNAWNNTKFVVKLVYRSLWEMVTGKVGVEQMSGPVGIVNEVNNAVNQGSHSWLYVLNLMALLTINLGVFNLLPFPALDGGRLFFMIVELIRRKPIPPEKEGMVHAIGIILLFALIIFISFNDILKLIG